MNLFILSEDPESAAQMQCDKHVVKMILETTQLLCTAHRVLDGTEYLDKTANGRKIKRWRLEDDRQDVMYVATHVNHPSAIWVRECSANYYWTFYHLVHLLCEYKFRYGKSHKCDELISMLERTPNNIKDTFTMTPFALAMKNEPQCIDENDPVNSYRKYYLTKKDRFVMNWTRRKVPHWFEEPEKYLKGYLV